MRSFLKKVKVLEKKTNARIKKSAFEGVDEFDMQKESNGKISPPIG